MGSQKIIFIFFLLITGINSGYADHITGGEMHYRYVGFQAGVHLYQGNLRLLMRCNSGRNFPNPIIIGVFSKENGARINDIVVPLASQETLSLSNNNPCISNPPIVCYEVATYIFDIAVPENQSGYLLSAQVNFRVNGLSNLLFGASGIGATYTAEIPGRGLGLVEPFKNNSAQFTGSDLVVVCAASPFTYSFQAGDLDGDSLRYSMCSAYQTGTTGGGGQALPPQPPPYLDVPYGQGFEGSQPLGARVSINPNTGLVSGIAPDAGYYVLTVCVEEIRSGVVIATQRKDIQLNIANCTVAAAVLPEDFLLCKESNEVTFENQSLSPLIQTYLWRLTYPDGRLLSTSTQSTFTHRFADTGTFRISLQTNAGLSCPGFASALVRHYPGLRADFDVTGFCFGSPTQFTDKSTTQYGTIVGWRWNFGEPSQTNNISTVTNPVLTYGLEGVKQPVVMVTNSNGCKDTARTTITISKEPPMQFNFRDTLICPPDTLTIQAKGSGVFRWERVAGILSDTNEAFIRVAPQATSLFSVIQQQGNCIALDTVRVRVTQSVSLSAMADTVICFGDMVQLRINSTASTFIWLPEETLSNPRVRGPFAKPDKETTYSVVAAISKCTATASIRVRVVPQPIVQATGGGFICFGAAANLNSFPIGDSVVWEPAAGLSNPFVYNPIAQPAITTTYTVKVFENKGCPKPGIDTIRVIVEPPINLLVTRDTSVVVGQPLLMNATGAPRFLWSPVSHISNPQVANPVFTFFEPAELLTYKVLGYNDAGCRDSLTVRIRVFGRGPSIYVPTGFTPNGDGLNETLKPTLAGMREFKFFRIFNRFGQLIFEANSPYDSWDGTFNGKTQPNGTFIWVVQAIDYHGRMVQQKGSTLLIR